MAWHSIQAAKGFFSKITIIFLFLIPIPVQTIMNGYYLLLNFEAFLFEHSSYLASDSCVLSRLVSSRLGPARPCPAPPPLPIETMWLLGVVIEDGTSSFFLSFFLPHRMLPAAGCRLLAAGCWPRNAYTILSYLIRSDPRRDVYVRDDWVLGFGYAATHVPTCPPYLLAQSM